MSISAHSINNPLALIAVLAATTEASALASLPLLDVRNQRVFVWFLVGFPPFLTALFFITLNFNRQAFAAASADAQPGQPEEVQTEALGASSPIPQSAAVAGAVTAITARPSMGPVATGPLTACLDIMLYADDDEWRELSAQVQAWAHRKFDQGPQASPCGLILMQRP